MFVLPPHLAQATKPKAETSEEIPIEQLEKEIPAKPDMSIFKAIFEDSDDEE